MRSKSEVIIADLLYAKDIEFQYERVLVGADGRERSPDFTIFDDTTGTTIYWEHLGMLQRPSYRRKWEKKLEWYRSNGILPAKRAEVPRARWLRPRTTPNGSISSSDIEGMVDELLG